MHRGCIGNKRKKTRRRPRRWPPWAGGGLGTGWGGGEGLRRGLSSFGPTLTSLLGVKGEDEQENKQEMRGKSSAEALVASAAASLGGRGFRDIIYTHLFRDIIYDCIIYFCEIALSFTAVWASSGPATFPI